MKMKMGLKEGRAAQVFFAAAGVLFFLASGWFLVKQNIFRVEMADRSVYGAGLFVASVLWCYFCFFYAEELWKNVKALRNLSCRNSNLRTLLFAATALLGMYYFNSGSNHGHRVATRYSLICFAVILMTYRTKEELFHKRNPAIAAGCAVLFITYAATGLLEVRKRHEFVLSYFVAVLFGVLLCCFISDIRQKKLRNVSVSYAALLFGFFVLLILFRNTRGWVFTVTVPFTLLYLRDADEADWKGLFREFCNGVLLSFGAVLAFSLLFRPYHKLFAPRYPMAFYSVATCSLYLTVVFLAAAFRLLDGFYEERKWKEQFGNLIVIGTVFCYTVMTVSRTAFLAIIAACAAAFFCLAAALFERRIGKLFIVYIAACVSAVILFPLVYTMTRSIPALVGHPFIMGGEMWEGETITSEDPIDSEKYMDIRRLRSITVDKLFGDSFDKLFDEEEANSVSGDSILRAPYKAGNTALLPMVLVAHGVTPDTWYNESEGNLSNGRIDIFLAYLERMNLTGHDVMGVETETMSYPHAHNTFLQTAYDHGVLVGVYFLVLGAVSLIRAICFCVRTKDNIYAVLPVMMITAFGVAGLTEWTFHPSILLGFTLLLVQGPLLSKLPGKKENKQMK